LDICHFAGFEADRKRYQLRHENRTIKLERIPLELLFLLLENRGSLVSRAQIVARIWGDNVFLDTERSINTAVRKLRKALGEDPHHPQFIETVVGKGYRFIAELIPERQLNDVPFTTKSNGTKQENNEIRLRDFSIETMSDGPVLTCEVVVSNIRLGRLPVLEIELPDNVTLPVKPEDRLLLKLHGVRITLTAKAAQALHAFSISVLQSGLRTRADDASPLPNSSVEHLPPQMARVAAVEPAG
jgi:DNA-binding winged helix-turn-helix (wHTH) protein